MINGLLNSYKSIGSEYSLFRHKLINYHSYGARTSHVNCMYTILIYLCVLLNRYILSEFLPVQNCNNWLILPVLTITGFGETKFSNTFLKSRYKSGVAEVAVLNLQFLLDGQIFFSYFIVGKFSDIVDCHNFLNTICSKKSWFYDIISIACAISF